MEEELGKDEAMDAPQYAPLAARSETMKVPMLFALPASPRCPLVVQLMLIVYLY